MGCELPWLTRLCELWREIGFDQETVTKRIDTLSMHLDKIWEGLVDEEDEIKSNITKKVELVRPELMFCTVFHKYRYGISPGSM